MTLSSLEMGILDILSGDSRIPYAQIAVMLGAEEAAVAAAAAALEEKAVLVGYPALIDWDKTAREQVQAVIEVKVTPQRDMGFDAIAERIYRFEEVKAVYLMSGAYDLMLEVQADSMKRLAGFVAQRLATIEHVLSTATHFVLKKYKLNGLVLEKKPEDERLVVSP
ncbi:MAG: Lrp/AsnC family transcriptional regulator [Christensenellaceae bacterium]|jgi:DNA-binding Lrp family transcriptional regulator|nr:Lrp/AsnC family transcriptional regulator [Christensenellaceae bacterium]